MRKQSISIAAFCARGREIGCVLIQEGRIVWYGVKTIKGKRNGAEFTRHVARVLLSLFERLTPRYLVVVEDVSHRTTPGAVNQEIQKLGKKWTRTGSYHVKTVSLQDVKHRICNDHTVSHRVLIEAVVTRYPLLAGLRRDFAIYRPLYWELVILAVALADTATDP